MSWALPAALKAPHRRPRDRSQGPMGLPRPAWRFLLDVARQSQAGKLPALVWVEEVAVGRPRMSGRRRDGAAAQDHLVDHELAVVFADRAADGPESGIGPIGAFRPLPDMPGYLVHVRQAARGLPFHLGRQARA